MHPALIDIRGFTIGTYGVMIVIGLLAALWLCSRLARRRGLSVEFFSDLLFVVLAVGFLGARLTYIFLNWSEFLKAPLAMIFSRQGFVFLGGFLCAVAAAAWFTRWRRMPIWETADIAAPAVALGHAFGRVGCFLAGCCHGMICTPANHPLLAHAAVSFPVVRGADGVPNEMFNFAYSSQVMAGQLSPLADRTLPMLPVQLLETAGNLAICAFLYWLWGRRKFSGQTAAPYLGLYSILRFALEFWRGDVERGEWSVIGGQLSTSQIITLFTIAAAAAIWAVRRKAGLTPVVPLAEEPPPLADKQSKPRRRRGASA